MLCYVMLCYVMLCYVMLCYVMLCYVMLCYVMLCYVMLCYVMLCYVMLCYVMLCYVMLCYVMIPNRLCQWRELQIQIFHKLLTCKKRSTHIGTLTLLIAKLVLSSLKTLLRSLTIYPVSPAEKNWFLPV